MTGKTTLVVLLATLWLTALDRQRLCGALHDRVGFDAAVQQLMVRCIFTVLSLLMTGVLLTHVVDRRWTRRRAQRTP